MTFAATSIPVECRWIDSEDTFKACTPSMTAVSVDLNREFLDVMNRLSCTDAIRSFVVSIAVLSIDAEPEPVVLMDRDPVLTVMLWFADTAIE